MAVIVVLVMGAACTDDDAESDEVARPDSPILTEGVLLPEQVGSLVPSGTWILTEVVADETTAPPYPGLRTIVTVDDDGFAVATCIPGAVSVEGEVLGLDGVPASLAMACVDPDERPDAVIEALERIEDVESSADGHVLTGPGVAVRLAAPAPVPTEVFDRTWRLVEWLPTLQNELVPAVAPSTLLLHADGRFEGTSGCGEEISGIWEPQDDGLRTPIFDITAPCDDPDPEIVDQHGWVTMLGAGIRPVLTDDNRMLIVIGIGANDRVSLVYE